MAEIAPSYGGYSITYNGSILGYDATRQAPNTLVLLFETGVTPVFSKGTATQLGTDPNIWELTANFSDWSALLANQGDLLAVYGIGAPATDCTMSGGVTDCPAFETETTGNGDAHNNMMPYIALVYLIQAEPDTPPGPVIPSMVLFNGALPVGPSGAYIAGRK